MQSSVNPGYRKTLRALMGPGKRILSAILVLLFTTGFYNEANALPPGVPDMGHNDTRITVIKKVSKADGIEQNIVVAHVVDSDGNPVDGVTVYFRAMPGNVTVAVTTGGAAGSGNARLELARESVGTVTITARVGGTYFENEETVVFVDPEESVLVILIDNARPNNLDQNVVRAIVRDDDGNVVANQSVTFNIVSGTGTFIGSQTITTNANGEADISLVSTVEGLVTISATINSATPTVIANTVTVTFRMPRSFLRVVEREAIADDVDLTTVMAVIYDENGERLPGATVKFTMADGTAVFVGSDELVTDLNGIVVINLQSTLVNIVHITATANGVPIIEGSPAEVEFVPGPPARTELIVDVDNADADGVAQNVVRVRVTDQYGNGVPGVNVAFTYTGDATAGGPLTLTTDEDGNAVLTLTSTTVGTVDVSATADGAPVQFGNPSTVRFTTYPDETSLHVVTNNATANNTATNSVRAHVVDNLGNPMAGAVVVFTITSGDATIITPQPVVTDVNGNAIILLTSGTVGEVTITATADGRPIVNGSPARIKFTQENLWVPPVFTPNGDGTNDVIRPIVNGVFNLQYFNIYNRWGNLLFTTNNITQGWDGRFKGVMQPNETYLWIIVGTNAANERVQKRGMISLVR
jgi:adhesin/invasin